MIVPIVREIRNLMKKKKNSSLIVKNKYEIHATCCFMFECCVKPEINIQILSLLLKEFKEKDITLDSFSKIKKYKKSGHRQIRKFPRKCYLLGNSRFAVSI